jgi:hypothetical protein
MGKQFRFEDLQPHVDVLCDALENKGASPSGISYEPEVYPCAQKYRDLLTLVREKRVDYDAMAYALADLREYTLSKANNNQVFRITKIVDALDIFIRKEYYKYTN